MNTQQRTILTILITSQLIVSCKERDYYYEQDKRPQIELVNQPITDTMKINTTKVIEYEATDEDGDTPQVTVIEYGNNIGLQVEGKKIKLTSKQEGESQLIITARDIYGKEGQQNLTISIIKNTPPIAKIEVTQTSNLSNNEIKIDASQSYDTDARYGGHIIMYEYNISNSYDIKTDRDHLNYIFKERGYKNIRVRVQDNDKEWSEWIEQTINIQ